VPVSGGGLRDLGAGSGLPQAGGSGAKRSGVDWLWSRAPGQSEATLAVIPDRGVDAPTRLLERFRAIGHPGVLPIDLYQPTTHTPSLDPLERIFDLSLVPFRVLWSTIPSRGTDPAPARGTGKPEEKPAEIQPYKQNRTPDREADDKDQGPQQCAPDIPIRKPDDQRHTAPQPTAGPQSGISQ